MSKLETAKKVTGFVSNLGASMLVGAITSPIMKSAPNPVIKVIAWFGSIGLQLAAGNAAQKAMEAYFQELTDAFKGDAKIFQI